MTGRTGILGGTFDPIHIGHLRAAIETAERFCLDSVRIIPNRFPPHRDTPAASPHHRYAMVERAVCGLPGFRADSRELEREQPSYTIDTLISLRSELGPEHQIFLLIGLDAFCALPSWHRWRELLDYCHMLVLQRPDIIMDVPEPVKSLAASRMVQEATGFYGSAGQIAWMHQEPMEISATRIRKLAAQGSSIKYLVPDQVFDYIAEHNLYIS